MRVEQVRGGVVEAWHDVHVGVVDGAGALVAGTGDPELVTFWRSAAKPFQALPLVEDRVVERFGLTTEELALVCASHSSEPGQVARVRDLLAKIGCAERDLLLRPHPELIAGSGRPCTELMRAHPGRVIAKVGAEGVYCAVLPREGLGVALKVADGHGLAAALAMAAVLEELGLRPRPASLGARPNVNTRGETVGELRVNGGLSK